MSNISTLFVFLLFLLGNVVQSKRFYITRYGACTGCARRGYGYSFCYVWNTWDYCSLQAGYTARGNECKSNHPCHFHGKNYLWCQVKGGGWDYCSWVEDNSRVDYSSAGEECNNYCDIVGDRYRCSTRYNTSAPCSLTSGITSDGASCTTAPNGDSCDTCVTRGHKFTWCITTAGSWGFCSNPAQDTVLLTDSSSNSVPTICQGGKMVQLEVSSRLLPSQERRITAIYAEAVSFSTAERINSTHQNYKSDAENAIYVWHRNKKPSETIHEQTLIYSGRIRLHYKGLVYSEKHGIFQKYLLMKNEPDSFKIAEVNIPEIMTDIPERYWKKLAVSGLHYSLNRGSTVWIFQQQLNNFESDLLCPRVMPPTSAPIKEVAVFIVESLQIKPFKTNESLVALQSETGKVKFAFGNNFLVECADHSWNFRQLTNLFQNIKESKNCLHVIWTNHLRRDDQEIWTISGRRRCKNQQQFLKISNCYVKNQILFRTSGLALENIPNPYPIAHIDPTLYVFLKGKPAYILSFQDSKTRPLFTEKFGLCANTRKDLSLVIFIVSGFKSRDSDGRITKLKNELLNLHQKNEVMVIIVGWEKGTNLWPWQYAQAAANTKAVGTYVGNIIRQVREEIPAIRIWGIGYNLGAHIMGMAGRSSGQKVNRITGLDPAGPLFETVLQAYRLTHADANYVDVIHTDGTSGINSRTFEVNQSVEIFNQIAHYGTLLESGHADFYPNWGYQQPGADWGPFGSNSHARAVELFTWSISHPGVLQASAYLMKGSNPIMELHELESSMEMGYYSSGALQGKFYLKTNSEEPWVNSSILVAEEYKNIPCFDTTLPRVTIRSIADAEYQVINVFVHKKGKSWKEVFQLFWFPKEMSAVLSVHTKMPSREDNHENRQYMTYLCRHGKDINVPNGGKYDTEIVQFFKGISPSISNIYDIETQSESLQNQMFQEQTSTNYFMPASLVPMADIFSKTEWNFHSFRGATFLFQNTAPQWIKVNVGNWKVFEKDFVREMILESFLRGSKEQFKIFSLPYYGHLSTNGKSLYLSRTNATKAWDKIRIPNKFVKIATKKNCANTFVVYNQSKMSAPHRLKDCPKTLSKNISKSSTSGQIECFVGVPSEILDLVATIDKVTYNELQILEHAESCFGPL